MKEFLASVLLMVSATLANACPDYTLWGNDRYEYSARDLYQPRGFNVVAGGQYNLASCGFRAKNWSGPMPGYMIKQPDFSITVNNLSGFQIEFRVVSDCDSTLLINTAARNWYFDDDDNGNADPKIRLTRPASNGIYDIWIGTFDGSQCNAQLIVETF